MSGKAKGKRMVRRGRRERARLIDAYRRGDLTQRAFAERHEVGYGTFVGWLRKERKDRHGEGGSSGVKFTEVTVAAEGPADLSTEVLLGDGIRRGARDSGSGKSAAETVMLHLSASLKIYLEVGATDLGKSFNGLYALAANQLQEDPRPFRAHHRACPQLRGGLRFASLPRPLEWQAFSLLPLTPHLKGAGGQVRIPLRRPEGG